MTPEDDIAEHQFIAMIGVACRFPGAAGPEQLWQQLIAGFDGITRFDRQELLAAGVAEALVDNPAYVPARGVLEGEADFDASFFGISDREARIMDPQLRLLMESSYLALEDAGYPPGVADRDRTGVYVGIDTSSYLLNQLLPDRELMATQGMAAVNMVNDKDFAASQIAYRLDLRGPAVNVNTACSTSAVAVHQACRSLLSFDADLVLAGGASLAVPQVRGYLFEPGGILSPDGFCRTFDADARGTVLGSGVGVVVLKRLEDAVADGDSITAVIRGSAANNDGGRRLSFSAPGVDGQAQVISEALALAEVEAESVGYVECHGTGTALGDPIELRALAQAFDTPRPGSCAIGSIKTNIGHLNIASGIAGIVKTALCLRHGMLPASLHFHRPNPEFDFGASPFFVNSKTQAWQVEEGEARRAGVSSFGIGGTNVHLVMEEWRPSTVSEEAAEAGPQLLPVSAQNPQALKENHFQLRAFLEEEPSRSLADAAYTLQEGRIAYPYRSWIVAGKGTSANGSGAGAEERDSAAGLGHGSVGISLRDPLAVGVSREMEEALQDPPVVFLFPGQGAQHRGMAAGLYETRPVFRRALDGFAHLLKAAEGVDLLEVLASPLEEGQTHLVQPALFAVELALVELWRSVGVTPWAVAGHSLGEYTAACVAGVFPPEVGLRLLALRGRLMAELPQGRMLEMSASEQEAKRWLTPEVALAAVNGPDACVLSGPTGAIAELKEKLGAAGVSYRPLRTQHAFHSPMMMPVQERLLRFLESVSLEAPRVPMLSNLTGEWVTNDGGTSDEQMRQPSYWAEQLISPVRFSAAMEKLAPSSAALLEVGPGRTLSSLAKQHPGIVRERVLATCRHPGTEIPDETAWLEAVGGLWQRGKEVRWSEVRERGIRGGKQRLRISLPGYSFQHRHHWNAPPSSVASSSVASSSVVDPSLVLSSRVPASRDSSVEIGFYRPTWKQVFESTPLGGASLAVSSQRTWVILGDRGGVAPRLAAALRGLGAAIEGGVGEESPRNQVKVVAAQDHDASSLGQMWQRLQAEELWPAAVVDLRPLDLLRELDLLQGETDREKRGIDLGFQGLLTIAQSFLPRAVRGARQEIANQPVRLLTVTAGAIRLAGEETVYPELPGVAALAKVIRQEHPHLDCQHLDFSVRDLEQVPDRLVEGIIRELLSQDGDLRQPQVAYRSRHRWVPGFERLALPEPKKVDLPLRDEGVYLITGGLGRIGLTLASFVVDSCHRPKLVLLGRSGLSRSSESTEGSGGASAVDFGEQQQAVDTLRKAGAEVLVVTADVSSLSQLSEAIEEAQAHWGKIHGVFHAAGLAANNAAVGIEELDLATYREQLSVKVEGPRNLVRCLADSPDFFLACSSLASHLGGLGFGAYAAASAYLDSWMADRHLQLPETLWLSVQWDGWSPLEIEEDVSASLLSSSEGAAAVAKVLAAASRGGSAVAVVKGDFEGRYEEWVLRRSPTASEQMGAEGGKGVELEERILRVWRRLFGNEDLGATDDFFDLGGNSLLAVRLTSLLQQEVGLTVSAPELLRHSTVRALVEALAAPGEEPNWNPISIVQEGSSLAEGSDAEKLPPLFCVHGAGGALLNFPRLAGALGPAQPVMALQARGLEEGHGHFESLESMARFYLPYLIEASEGRAVHLLGYCFGGLVAYEIARQLLKAGIEVGFLGLIDTPLPEATAAEAQLSEQDEVGRLMLLFGHRLGVDESELRQLDENERLLFLVQGARGAGLLPQEMEDGTALRYLQLFENHLDLQTGFEPQTYPGDVKFFRAAEGGLLTGGRSTSDGWEALVQGDFAVRSVLGDHWSMLDQPHVVELAEELKRSLLASPGRHSLHTVC